MTDFGLKILVIHSATILRTFVEHSPKEFVFVLFFWPDVMIHDLLVQSQSLQIDSPFSAIQGEPPRIHDNCRQAAKEIHASLFGIDFRESVRPEVDQIWA